jgi:hypothetical protein
MRNYTKPLDKDERACYGWLESEFMSPELAFVTRKNVGQCFLWENEAQPRRYAGWWVRLAASGYLDCTDWDGPFTCETAGKRYIIELYGDAFFEGGADA